MYLKLIQLWCDETDTTPHNNNNYCIGYANNSAPPLLSVYVCMQDASSLYGYYPFIIVIIHPFTSTHNTNIILYLITTSIIISSSPTHHYHHHHHHHHHHRHHHHHHYHHHACMNALAITAFLSVVVANYTWSLPGGSPASQPCSCAYWW